jgi:hypothetical protein
LRHEFIERWKTVAIFIASFGVLLISCFGLQDFSPTNGDFWWQDPPRHALNGAFVKDFILEFPWRDPVGWAMNYYSKYPSLKIVFYPPFFYLIEALFFTVFGVSHETAQFTVTTFDFVLGLSSYSLARCWLPRWSALGVAILFIGSPEMAFWGRQVMLEIPSFASASLSVLFLIYYIKYNKIYFIYLSVTFLVIGIYTRYTTGIMAFPMILAFITAKKSGIFRDKHAIFAASIGVLALIPAFYLFSHFNSLYIEDLGPQGDPSQSTLMKSLFYLFLIPHQLGYVTAAFAAYGAALCLVRPRATEHWLVVLFVSWFVIGYAFFSFLSLRGLRFDLLILYPVVLLAGIGFHRLFSGHTLSQIALLLLGIGTLSYSLFFYPPPGVRGYRQIAGYVANHAPPNGVIIYAGYRDGNFVFDLREHEERRDLTTVRADKLLLRLKHPVVDGSSRSQIIDSDQTEYSEEQIATLLQEYGVGMVVAQAGFWNDLPQITHFNNVLHSSAFKRVAVFNITGQLSSHDGQGSGDNGGIEIYEPTYPVQRTRSDLDFAMPFIKGRFTGYIK